jgi:hypothetical protein
MAETKFLSWEIILTAKQKHIRIAKQVGPAAIKSNREDSNSVKEGLMQEVWD